RGAVEREGRAAGLAGSSRGGAPAGGRRLRAAVRTRPRIGRAGPPGGLRHPPLATRVEATVVRAAAFAAAIESCGRFRKGGDAPPKPSAYPRPVEYGASRHAALTIGSPCDAP